MPKVKKKRGAWEQKRWDKWWEFRQELHTGHVRLVAMAKNPAVSPLDWRAETANYQMMCKDYRSLRGMPAFGGDFAGITEEELQTVPERPPALANALRPAWLSNQGRPKESLDNQNYQGDPTMPCSAKINAIDADSFQTTQDEAGLTKAVDGNFAPHHNEKAAQGSSVSGRPMHTEFTTSLHRSRQSPGRKGHNNEVCLIQKKQTQNATTSYRTLGGNRVLR